jgi:AraC-like DNA-binding protein
MPPLPQIPLAAHCAFSVSTVEALHTTVKSRLGAACVMAPNDRRVAALANYYKLPSSELWFCSYAAPVKIRFGETDYFRVQFQHAGAGTTQIGNRIIPVAPNSGCVSSGAVTLSFGPGFQQLEWRINRAALARKLAAITGTPLYRALEFEPALDLGLPRARALLGVLHSTVHSIPDSPTESNRFLLIDLEQALMASLLIHAEHNGAHLLKSKAGAAAPWHVRRVEEHIDANLDRPFDIEEAVSLTRCSARTIYRAFHQCRGYSPFYFSKQRRLSKAREVLRNPYFRSVTEVAYMCGFTDLSHFSRDFSAAFGEKPSAVRKWKGSTDSSSLKTVTASQTKSDATR